MYPHDRGGFFCHFGCAKLGDIYGYYCIILLVLLFLLLLLLHNYN